MKKFLKIAFVVLFFTPMILEASISSISVGRSSERINYQTYNYNGVEYRVFLTTEQISKYKDFDINKTPFPKSLDEIIAIAKKQINKIDSAALWEINNINLQMSYYGNNDKYWYYQISFTSAGRNSFAILVTLDGIPAKIVKIQEESLE